LGLAIAFGAVAFLGPSLILYVAISGLGWLRFLEVLTATVVPVVAISWAWYRFASARR